MQDEREYIDDIPEGFVIRQLGIIAVAAGGFILLVTRLSKYQPVIDWFEYLHSIIMTMRPDDVYIKMFGEMYSTIQPLLYVSFVLAVGVVFLRLLKAIISY